MILYTHTLQKTALKGFGLKIVHNYCEHHKMGATKRLTQAIPVA